MYIRHPDSLSQGHWGKGRVTLVGDAAHPMRPASGAPPSHTLHSTLNAPHCTAGSSSCRTVLKFFHSMAWRNCADLRWNSVLTSFVALVLHFAVLSTWHCAVLQFGFWCTPMLQFELWWWRLMSSSCMLCCTSRSRILPALLPCKNCCIG